METDSRNEIRTTQATPPPPPKAVLAQRLEETLKYETQLKIKVAGLQRVIDDKESEWQGKLQQMDQQLINDQKERELLVERIRQSEERNAALTHQFNELYKYSETLYQESEKRRKESELRCQELQNAADKLMRHLDAAIDTHEQLKGENKELLERSNELRESLNRKADARSNSLSALERGKECIDSAVRTLDGFHSSFSSYLESIEKNGITPVSQRTGRLLLEHWNVERSSVARVSGLLSDLLALSKNVRSKKADFRVE